jgi:hypothetical protein
VEQKYLTGNPEDHRIIEFTPRQPMESCKRESFPVGIVGIHGLTGNTETT